MATDAQFNDVRFPLSSKARASLQLAASAKQARLSHVQDLSGPSAKALRTALEGTHSKLRERGNSCFVTPSQINRAATSKLDQNQAPNGSVKTRLAELSSASRQVHHPFPRLYALAAHAQNMSVGKEWESLRGKIAGFTLLHCEARNLPAQNPPFLTHRSDLCNLT